MSDKAHKRWMWRYVSLAILFLLATNLVYVRLNLLTPPQHNYSGIGFEAAADKLVYYSMIEQGRRGILNMVNPHTSEAQVGSLFSPHWYVIGQSAELFNISPQLSYHMYRLILAALFVWFIYLFVSKLFHDHRHKLAAMASILFVSGFGWFYFVLNPDIGSSQVHWLQTFNRVPVDLYVTEMNTFSNFVQSPLFMLSYILIVIIWYLFLRYRDQRAWWIDLVLAASVIMLVLIHPYDALLIGSVIGTLFVWDVVRTGQWNLLRRTIVVGVSLGLSMLYHVWVLIREPALSGWLAQNLAFSPGLYAYIWGLGIIVPLSALGYYFLWRNKETSVWWKLIVIWSLIVMVSLYLPVSFNRRFANTLFIPLVLLSYYGVVHMTRFIRVYYVKMMFIFIMILFAGSGTLYRLAQYSLYQPTLDEKYVYYHDQYVSGALAVAREQFRDTDVLLVNENFIAILTAGYSPARLYVGHEHQTANYELKNQQMEWFFAPPTTDTALARKIRFLNDNNITYVMLYTPSLKTDSQWLSNTDFLVPLYNNEAFVLYKVQPLA